MKCENCGLEVDSRFQHAIKSNQCPACGKAIMSPESLASFAALKQLLSGFEAVDAEAVAGTIVANFELKQKFKLPTGEKRGSIEVAQEEVGSLGSLENVSTVEVEEDAEPDPDAEHKQKQMAEAKAILKQQAYESALRGQYGMGDEEDDFFESEDGPVDPVAEANRMKENYKKSNSQSNMLSGGGSFSRSG